MTQVSCDYCGRPAQLVTGLVLYPHRADLAAHRFWRCVQCDAYVGCHRGGDRPLGRLANAELRHWKQQAHVAFDPLWQFGRMSRSGAYVWLAERLGIDTAVCHIGMFDVAQCRAVVELMRRRPEP